MPADDFGPFFDVQNQTTHTIYLRAGTNAMSMVSVAEAGETGWADWIAPGDPITVLDADCRVLFEVRAPDTGNRFLVIVTDRAATISDELPDQPPSLPDEYACQTP